MFFFNSVTVLRCTFGALNEYLSLNMNSKVTLICLVYTQMNVVLKNVQLRITLKPRTMPWAEGIH